MKKHPAEEGRLVFLPLPESLIQMYQNGGRNPKIYQNYIKMGGDIQKLFYIYQNGRRHANTILYISKWEETSKYYIIYNYIKIRGDIQILYYIYQTGRRLPKIYISPIDSYVRRPPPPPTPAK